MMVKATLGAPRLVDPAKWHVAYYIAPSCLVVASVNHARKPSVARHCTVAPGLLVV
jgi:hypothetical protein